MKMSALTNKLSIVSWNINGIRSSKSVKTTLDSFDADIICFQETKITRDQVDESTALVDGYNAYFSFSRKRSGYSGVATYCKDSVTPTAAEEGLGSNFGGNGIGSYGNESEFTSEELLDLNSEGRAILTKHTVKQTERQYDIVVINVYCPRFDCAKPERLQYKLNFYKLLQQRAEAILKSGSHVIIVGDINSSHKPIDHCDPNDPEEFGSNPGRLWLDQFLESDTPSTEGGKFIDTFRYFHSTQENAFTCWSTVTRARENNYGTRIDYIFADSLLTRSAFLDSRILPDIEGSDHCPIIATLSCAAVPSAAKCPQLCAKFWPEFSGKQQKLSRYLTVNSKRKTSDSTNPEPQKIVKKLSTQKSITGYFHGRSSSDSGTTSVESQPAAPTPESDLNKKKSSMGLVTAWKSLLKGPDPPPLCKGHQEQCVLRIVKKQGPNFRRQFYVCARGEGHATNPEARCDFFQWAKAGNFKT